MAKSKKTIGPVEKANPSHEELLAVVEAEYAVDKAAEVLKQAKKKLDLAKIKIAATINDSASPLLTDNDA